MVDISKPYIQKWINSLPDKELFVACIENNVFDNVSNYRQFAKSFPTLKANPFAKIECGTKVEHYYQTRKKFYKTCLKNQIIDIGQKDSFKYKRYNFAAWSLWQKNRNKIYLQPSVIQGFCSDQSLNPKLFFAQLSKHPSMDNQYTFNDLRKKELAIADLINGSRSCIAKEHDDVSDAVSLSSCNLDQVQKDTVAMMLKNNVSFLQGGAGVGKTTTVGSFVQNIPKYVDVYCLAFTHKAKRCIASKLGGDGRVVVSTIHSFVLANGKPEAPCLRKCVILIDEASMLDVELAGDLADVISNKCAEGGYQIIFVGDGSQLPPIGRGELFRHMVDNGDPRRVLQLLKCYRTDKPDLFEAYQAIRTGKCPKTSANFHMMSVSTPQIDDRLLSVIRSMESGEQTKFIAWQNKDVGKINLMVQEHLLKKRLVGPDRFRHVCTNDVVVYVGDNDGQLTNSLCGKVVTVLARGVKVAWETGTITTVTHMENILLAYCITVHKSQGSEYDDVCVVCYDVQKMKYCLDRRWLYTAITRGKNKVTVIADDDELEDFVAMDLKPVPVCSFETA